MGKGGGPSIPEDSFKSDDVVELTLGICEGPIAGLVDGGRSFYLGETPLVSQGGNLNFFKFELHDYRGGDVASPVRNVLGGTTSNVSVSTTLAHNVPVVRLTPSNLSNTIDSLDVRIVFNRVLEQQDNGDVQKVNINLKMLYREVGTTTWNWFFGTDAWNEDLKISATSVKEFTKQVPRINGDWEVWVELAQDENDNHDINIAWESLQVTTADPQTYNNLALVRVLSEASDQLNGVPNLSADWNGKITKIPSNYEPVTRYCTGTWDGTFKDGFTDNPAWCLYDLLTNETYGAKAYYPDLLVDRFSFYDAAQWCDVLVPREAGGFQPRFTYNDVIDDQRDGHSMLHYIAAIFGGQLTEDPSGMIVLKVDKPGTIKSIFGPESVENGDFSYNYTDVETRPNTYNVTFINPDLGWEKDVRRIDIPAFVTKHGRTARDHFAVGCVDVTEAQRRAFLRLLRANTETLTATFKVPRQGMLLEVYDLIGISDPTMRWGLSGRIKSADGNQITLRDPLVVPVNTSMKMIVQSPGGATELYVQSGVTNAQVLTITSGVLPGDMPTHAQFMLEETTIGLVKPFRILSVSEDGTDAEVFTVTALEFNGNKFGDADVQVYSGTTSYSSDFASLGPPDTIVAQSGTEHLIKHPSGSIESRIFVTWNQYIPSTVEVFYRRVGVDDYQVITGAGASAYIPNVVDGADYNIKIRLKDGFLSQEITHTVVGKTALPAKVLGWTIEGGLAEIYLYGTPFLEADFKFFRIYGGALGDTFENAVLLEETPSTSYVRVIPDNDTIDQYWITAVDTSGNEGPPSDPLSLVDGPGSVNTIWDDIALSAQEAFERFNGAFDESFDRLAELDIDARVTDALETARVEGVVDEVKTELTAGVDGVVADLVQNYYTAATVDTALVASELILNTKIDTDVGAVTADLTNNYYTITSTDTAIANSALILNTKIDTDVGVVSSNLSNNYYTASSTDTAIAAQITTFNTTLGSQYADITTTTNSIDGIRAVHGVKINNNGAVSGYGLISSLVNGQVTSDFIIDADAFRVGKGASSGTYTSPFQVIGSTTYITKGRIQVADIDTLQIAGDAVTVASSSTLNNALVGGANQLVHSGSLYFDQSGYIIVLWSGAHGYDAGGPYAHDFQLWVNGSMVQSRGGVDVEDYPMLSYGQAVNAGTTSVAVYWSAQGIDLELSNRTLSLSGGKR